MFPSDTYIARRTRLKQEFKSGLLIFPGNDLSPMNYRDNIYPFRQDSTFLYYFGLNRPSLVAVIDIDNNREIVFGDDPSLDNIIWTGDMPRLEEESSSVGISDTRSAKELFDYMKKAVSSHRTVHFLPPYRELHTLMISSLTAIKPELVEKNSSLLFIKAVIEQREVKTDEEIGEIEKAVNLSITMHSNAIRQAEAGMKEAQVAAEVHRTALAEGFDLAFPIIATVNGHILHNYYYGNTLREGDIFLLDAGAQSPMGYAGDLSSSFPVSKRFTPRQKEIYQITWNAHQAAVQELRPGNKFLDVHRASCRALIVGLTEIGLMKGDPEEALASGAHALFFPCGVGHMMGLDVHDMENLGEEYVGYEGEQRSTQFGLKSLRLAKTLKPGFVHTIEPGIYFIPRLIEQWKTNRINTEFLNFDRIDKFLDFGGIRNEENFVITQTSCRRLGRSFSKEISDIEALRK